MGTDSSMAAIDDVSVNGPLPYPSCSRLTQPQVLESQTSASITTAVEEQSRKLDRLLTTSESNEAIQRRKEISDWIASMYSNSMDEIHGKLLDRHHRGTGKWFVEETKAWLDDADDKPIFWRRGIRKYLSHTRHVTLTFLAGSGKSVLM